MRKAGFGVGELERGVLLLPGDANPPTGRHHHRLDHVDLVPRDVRGSRERLEGRSLELEGDGTPTVDKHVKPPTRPGQSEPIVGRTSAPVDAHTDSNYPLKSGGWVQAQNSTKPDIYVIFNLARRGDNLTTNYRGALLIVRLHLKKASYITKYLENHKNFVFIMK